ncbi:MAG: hypothetical protein HS100_04515 [Anaerolineales bacterium]|nr:hypothetical protein [Anaerolineales bacterium]
MSGLTSVMFRIPKELEQLSECQDFVGRKPSKNLFCLADGVGQSFFPAVWARTLVHSFINLSDEQLDHLLVQREWKEWFLPLQGQWSDEVREIVDHARPEKYFLRNRLREQKPAGSTFVAIRFYEEGDSVRWKALCMGDSCIFQIRDNLLMRSFLPTGSADFDNFPSCFTSVGRQANEPVFTEGGARRDDSFILASDAFAKWLLKIHEENEDQFSQMMTRIIDLKFFSEFRVLIESARRSDISLEDDDTSCIVIRLSGIDTTSAPLVE